MIHSPYTPFFGDAFMAAHSAIGLLLIALLWWTFPKANIARTFLFGAIVLIGVAPLLGEFMRAFGGTTLPLTTLQNSLLIASCLVFAAMIACKRFALAFASLLVAAFLLKAREWLLDSWSELCAAHLIWVGATLGLVRRRAAVDDVVRPPLVERSFAIHDTLVFVIAMLAAAVAANFVLVRADGSADEWAYTWQASVFARGHLYATPPPCENEFQSFYVFESVGKMFSQYPPGWPLFMAPFVLFGVPWLAGPVCHGLMAIGIARLARRAVRLDGHATSARETYAGWLAALVATFGTTILICNASRFSHVFVAAAFAWSIDAILAISTKGLSEDMQTKWGIALGSLIALMGATRPADGATLSFGMALYYLYCLARRRIGWRALLGTLGGFVFFGGITLLILHAQIGEWFTTGYSLLKDIHPWAVAKYTMPKPNEWKYALPLATGSYAWFPCSLALGAAGIASLRGRASGITWMLVVAFFMEEACYQSIDLGRGFDWGYGPRYELPFVVLMATGTGVALAPLFENARRHFASLGALRAGGPAAISIFVIAVTLVRLWPLLYPGIYAHVRQHDGLNQRIRDMNIHHAIVIAELGTTGFDGRDVTENLPIDLYPNQDVLIALERTRDSERCLRTSYPTRTIYHAYGNPVVVTP